MNIINLNTQTANPFPSLDDSKLVFPVTTRPLYAFNRKTEEADIHVPNHWGVLRPMDGKAVSLGVVGDKYKILPNRDAFEAAEDGFMRSMTPAQLQGVKVEETMSYEGAWTSRSYIFPSVGEQAKSLGLHTTDLGFRCIITNSYDGSSSLRMITGLIDFYCSNGMISGTMIDQSKRRHTAGLTASHVGGVIDQSLANLQEELRRLQVMGDSAIDTDSVAEFFGDVFSEQRATRMLEQYEDEAKERGFNMWAVYSAMTNFASHNSELFPVRDTGQDNVAKTLSDRQDEVARIVRSNAFTDLLIAA